MPCYYVYILASKRNGTLYVGVTADIARRVHEHKSDAAEGFTRRYKVHRLVYVETHEELNSARARERTLKRWRRAWKIHLIEQNNPQWRDFNDDILT